MEEPAFPMEPEFPMNDGLKTPPNKTPEENKIPATPDHIKRETERTMQQAIRLEKLTQDTKRRMEVIVRDAEYYPGYIPKEEEYFAREWLDNYNKIRPPMPYANDTRLSNASPYTLARRGGGSYLSLSKPIATPLTYATARKVNKTNEEIRAMNFLSPPQPTTAEIKGYYYPTAVATPKESKKSKKSKKGGKRKNETKKRANQNKN